LKHILAAALLCAALPASAATYPMAGAWFGTGQPDDRSSMYIDTFLPDGRFAGQFRACFKGKALDETDAGTWSVTGDILTIAIATVNGKAAPRRDAYRLLSVDATTQSYIFLATNFAYKSHKVAGGFAMPSCDLTS
jgi:hypothetical protein